MFKNTHSKTIAIIIALLLVVNLVADPFNWIAQAAGNNLTLQKSVSKTEVKPGEVFTYTLKYANPSTTVHASNVVVTDEVPASLEVVSYQTSVDVDHVEQNGNTVAFVMKEPLTAGKTGFLQISAKFKEGVTLNNTIADNQASISDSIGTNYSEHVLVTAKTNAVADWAVSKSVVTPANPIVPALGQPVTYKVTITGNSRNGGVNMENVRVTDTLPANSEFVSASGTYSRVGDVISWDAFNLAVGTSKDFYVTVKYLAPAFAIGNNVTNAVTVLANLLGNPTDVSKSANVTHTFAAPTSGVDNFVKAARQTNDKYSIGQTAKFYLSKIANKGNVPMDKFVITDVIPAGIQLTKVTTGSYNSATTVKVSYVTNLVPGPTEWTTASSPNNQSLLVSALGLAPGDFVTQVIWEITNGTDGLPAGFSESSAIGIEAEVLPAAHGTNITNTATLVGSTTGFPDSTKTDNETIQVINPVPWVVAGKAVSGATTVNMNDEVTYKITLKNHEFATGNYENPVAAETLPSEFENFAVVSYKKNGAVYTPAVDPLNIAGSLYKWTFTGEVLQPGESIEITYKAKVVNLTSAGDIINDIYVSSTTQTTYQNAGVVAPGALGLANTAFKATAKIFVKFTGALSSKNLVKGILDTGWSNWDTLTNGVNFGKTLPGGIADYQLKVENDGSNGPIKNIVLIDVLPRLGDTGVIDPAGRGTEWTPYIVNKVVWLDYTDLDGAGQPKEKPITDLNPNAKIYYTTNAAPSKAELYNSITGGAANPGGAGDGWTLTTPDDITTVKAVKIDFGPSFVLSKNQSVTLKWPMRAPVGAVTDKLAWNSFAYGATYPDADNTQSSFLPSEPLKIGFKIQPDPAPPAAHNKIGNYVWEDMNKNGLQDDGVAAGINGVLVNLYTEAVPGSGIFNTKINYTRTGNNLGGNPGYYEFPALADGNYQVEFVYPTTYRVAPFSVGADPAVNSKINPVNRLVYTDPLGDGTDNGKYTVKAAPITLLNNDNMNQDAGLYRVGSIGDYVWHDKDRNGNQGDSAADGKPVPLQGVTVELTDSLGAPVFDADGVIVGAKITNASGNYVFQNLDPGNYRVQFTTPTHFVPTTKGAAVATANNSDVNVATGLSDVVSLKSNEAITYVDAGFHLARVGDKVWNDLNRDGDLDGGEPAISGVTVKLRNVADDTLATNYYGDNAQTTTNGSGDYAFNYLKPGAYYLEFSMPAGFNQATLRMASFDEGAVNNNKSSIDRTTLKTTIFILMAGEQDLNWDAGFYKYAALGDRVWKDLNTNGIQDTSYAGVAEPGFAGVTVQLLDSAGNPAVYESGLPVPDQVTNATGNYAFTGLNPGTYKVKFINPDATKYQLSPKASSGSTGSNNSDANVATGITDNVTLTSGQTNNDIDAGYYSGFIGNFVWRDNNGNGIQDAGEPGVSGVSVILYDGIGTSLSVTTTNANGFYSFSDLPTGDYQIGFVKPATNEFTPSGKGVNTGSNADTGSDADGTTGKTPVFNLGLADVDTSWDAGIYVPIKIGDYVWIDMNIDHLQDGTDIVLPGTTVKLFASGNPVALGTTVTDASGKYEFNNLLPGNYSLEFIAPKPYYTAVNASVGADATKNSKVDATGKIASVTLVSGQNNLTLDAGFKLPVPTISLKKTVYHGHNNGVGAATATPSMFSGAGTSITYVFTVKNTGKTHLKDITVTDALLGITQADMSIASGTLPLAPDATIVYYYETTHAGGNVVNNAVAVGTTIDVDGNPIPNVLLKPTDNSTATITGVTPNIAIQKTVYPGHDLGVSYLTGKEKVYGIPGQKVTYVFKVTNTGDSKLNAPVITDAVLGITNANMTLINGALPLAPNAVLYYYYESTITSTVTNTAHVIATPVDDGGNPIPVVTKPQATDIADVVKAAPAIKLDKTVYNGHDAGAKITSGVKYLTVALNAPITYVFKVTNMGNTHLTAIKLDDVDLAKKETDMVLKSGTLPLAPGQSLYYYYQTTMTKGLVNNASVKGMPADDTGTPYIDAAELTDTSFAQVVPPSTPDVPAPPVYVPSPAIKLEKRVYVGNDNGASYGSGVKNLTGEFNQPIVYVFTATNTGNTLLKNITINDPTLGIDQTRMVKVAGNDILLGPGQSVTFAVNSVIKSSLVNTATASGTPADSSGTPYPGMAKPTSDDSATVSMSTVIYTGEIGNYVWEDLNYNGIQDAIELGKPGVLVELSNAAGTVIRTATTGPQGDYLFDGLQPGGYYVKVIVPEAFKLSPASQGGNVLTDSNGQTDGRSAEIQLALNEKNLSIDFGMYKITEVAGVVKDPDGKPVPGATVTLKDKEGNVLGQVITDVDGEYLFEAVPGNLNAIITTVKDDVDLGEIEIELEDGKVPLGSTTEPKETANDLLANLPPTGTPYFNIMAIGLVLLLVSGGFFVLSRRQREDF